MIKPATLFVVISLFSGLSLTAQDHGHLNVGASGQTQVAPLLFENGGDFATASQYVKTMNLASSGKYTGYYEGNISLTVLHSTNAFGESIPNAPAPGSFIAAEIVSVEGPAGGEFGFWDVDSTATPTHSIPVGTSNGTFSFVLSNAELGAGQPGGDPFGHIHGRRFTATKAGFYKVGFRAIDSSTSGQGSGPIHTPSDLLHIHFQAGVNIVEVEPVSATSVRVTSALPLNFIWNLESKDSVAAAWTPIATDIPGTDKLLDVIDDRPTVPTRFYRLSGLQIEP